MKYKRTVIRLSILIAIFSLLAAGLGVFWQGEGEVIPFTTIRGEAVMLYGHGLYQYDTTSVVSQAIAQDIVTLLLGLPLLITGIALSHKEKLRGQLLLAGTLGYFLYTYTSYVFLSAFNPLFLLYVSIFSLTLFAFVFAMMGLKPELVAARIAKKFPRKSIATFLYIIAGFLLFAWLGRIVPATLAGTPPIGLESYTTLVIQALDLGIIVPLAALSAFLLLRRQPWGYTLAAIVLVKGLTLGAALIAMIVSQILAGFEVNIVEVVMFSSIALAALVFTVMMFNSIEAEGI